jgi:hypothetical protein
MIKLRIDVDYPYPSRAKSFLYVGLRIKNNNSKDYLRNAFIISRMINDSPREVRGYWFFTPYTIPNKELLGFLNPERHEIALHVANNPVEEWKILEGKTNRKVTYYTIHGTQRLFARLLWGRKLSQSQASISADFPLTSFHALTTMSLDRERYRLGFKKSVSSAEEWIDHDVVLSFHPEWLLEQNKKNHRGPVYDVLQRILKVDSELESLSVTKKLFFKIGHDTYEYQKNITPSPTFIKKLVEQKVDIYTFLDRAWCCPISNPQKDLIKTEENVGLLEIKNYDSWWQSIGKKTRNMVRRAEKSGITVTVVGPSAKLAEGIWKIYNETPIRQARAFTHYGESIQTVTDHMYDDIEHNTFIGAYLEGKLVGFIQILYGDSIAIISNILSLQVHWDKSVNNALLAKAVEICASKGERWLMYGRIGNHPSLDRFKANNGFVGVKITRYFIVLSNKGRLAVSLGLHKELRDSLTTSKSFLKNPVISATNWFSRTKVHLKLRLKRLK